MNSGRCLDSWVRTSSRLSHMNERNRRLSGSDAFTTRGKYQERSGERWHLGRAGRTQDITHHFPRGDQMFLFTSQRHQRRPKKILNLVFPIHRLHQHLLRVWHRFFLLRHLCFSCFFQDILKCPEQPTHSHIHLNHVRRIYRVQCMAESSFSFVWCSFLQTTQSTVNCYCQNSDSPIESADLSPIKKEDT